LLRLLFSPRVRLLAEILFLRRQLALFQERQAKARRPSRWSKLALVWLSKLFDWRNALFIGGCVTCTTEFLRSTP